MAALDNAKIEALLVIPVIRRWYGDLDFDAHGGVS